MDYNIEDFEIKALAQLACSGGVNTFADEKQIWELESILFQPASIFCKGDMAQHRCYNRRNNDFLYYCTEDKTNKVKKILTRLKVLSLSSDNNSIIWLNVFTP